jgi:hypothetical protein
MAFLMTSALSRNTRPDKSEPAAEIRSIVTKAVMAMACASTLTSSYEII